MKNTNLNLLLSHLSFRKMALLMLYFTSVLVSSPKLVSNFSGIVLNGETHEPLENAVIQIKELDLFDVTDNKGVFSFKDIPEGQYTIIINFLGYRPLQENINLKINQSRNLLFHLFPIPIQSATVIITGEHPTSELDALHESVNVLKGKDLQRDLGLTLASTLKNETGLAVRSMGPAPARPVIRGLGGDRVVISEDGNNINDLSATAPDHAVTVEPFTAERIEVVRGPKVLCKTSTTIGSVVNVIREEIPGYIPDKLTGNIGLLGESANRGYLGSAGIMLPLNPVVIRGEISDKSADDLRTPVGKLENSDLQTINFSSGFNLIKNWGSIGASFRQFKSDYGVPGGFVGAHPFGIDINMFKRQFNARFKLNINKNNTKHLEANISRVYYHHTEYEAGGAIGSEFVTLNYTGDVKFIHNIFNNADEGILGISSEYRDFNIGGFVFTPPSKSLNISGYIFESYSKNKVDLQFSARYNYGMIKPNVENPVSKIGYIRGRIFHTYSLSASILYNLFNGFYIGSTFSRTSRIPTIEELFSQGPHLAAYSYEVGNPELKSERGFGTEILSFYKSQNFFAMVTLFRNELPYYIIPRNTGTINFNTLLPVYASSGTYAVLTGFETQIDMKFLNYFTFSSSISFTNGKVRNSGNYLPAIPPLKIYNDFKYSANNFIAGITTEIADKQHKVDQFELPTEGYTIFNAYMQYSLASGSNIHSLSFGIDNIFNKEYRNHLSRVKIIMPESSRNIKIIYRFYF